MEGLEWIVGRRVDVMWRMWLGFEGVETNCCGAARFLPVKSIVHNTNKYVHLRGYLLGISGTVEL